MNLYDFSKIDLNAGCPPETMEDSQWHEYFAAMKLLVSPSGEKRMSTRGMEFRENGKRVSGRDSTRQFSQWWYYCQFINSVLTVIRNGGKDYCFNVYQITELLKYEHDRLRTKWLKENRCFEVWLDFKSPY